MSRFLESLGNLVEEAFDTTLTAAEGVFNTAVTAGKGTINVAEKVLDGELIGAVETAFKETGNVVGEGLRTTKEVAKGTVNTAFEGMNTVVGAKRDMNDAAGSVGYAIAGETGEKAARLLLWAGPGDSGDADGSDGSDDGHHH